MANTRRLKTSLTSSINWNTPFLQHLETQSRIKVCCSVFGVSLNRAERELNRTHVPGLCPPRQGCMCLCCSLWAVLRQVSQFHILAVILLTAKIDIHDHQRRTRGSSILRWKACRADASGDVFTTQDVCKQGQTVPQAASFPVPHIVDMLSTCLCDCFAGESCCGRPRGRRKHIPCLDRRNW